MNHFYLGLNDHLVSNIGEVTSCQYEVNEVIVELK